MGFVFSVAVSELGHSAFALYSCLRIILFSCLPQMVLSTSFLKVIYIDAGPPIMQTSSPHIESL